MKNPIKQLVIYLAAKAIVKERPGLAGLSSKLAIVWWDTPINRTSEYLRSEKHPIRWAICRWALK